MSIPGMMAAADVVKKELQHLRSDEVVKNMLASAELKVEGLSLDPFVNCCESNLHCNTFLQISNIL